MEDTTIYPPLTAEEFKVGSYDHNAGVPLIEDEHGDHVYAYGHVDIAEFLAAVAEMERDFIGYDPDGYPPSAVAHRKAVTVQPPDGPDGWWINWGDEYQDHPFSFPITVLTR